MEEIHAIREKMYTETTGMSVHEKLMLIKERAATFKAKYGLKTKPSSRKEKHIAERK
jgi:hypothetical protein